MGTVTPTNVSNRFGMSEKVVPVIQVDEDGNYAGGGGGGGGAVTAVQLPASLGSKADAASLAVTQSTEDKAALAAIFARLLELRLDDENGNPVEWASVSRVHPAIPTTPINTPAASLGLDTTAGAASVTVMAAAGASLRNYMTYFSVEWEALTAATEWHFRDGAAGTILYGGKTPAALAGRHPNPPGLIIRSTANTLIEFRTITATTAGRIWVNVGGHVAA